MDNENFTLCVSEGINFTEYIPQMASMRQASLRIGMPYTVTNYIIWVLLGLNIVCNSTVFLLFGVFKDLRTRGNFLLFNLAIADVLTSGFAILQSIRPWVLQHRTCGNVSYFHYRTIVIYLQLLSASQFPILASLYFILGMSVDRYAALTSPLQYSFRVSKFRVAIFVVFVWVFCLSVYLIPWYTIFKEGFVFVSVELLIYMPPVIAILGLYARIYIIARKNYHHKGKSPRIPHQEEDSTTDHLVNEVQRSHSKSPRPLDEESTPSPSATRRFSLFFTRRGSHINFHQNLQAAKTCGIVAFVIVVSWLPWYVKHVILDLVTHGVTNTPWIHSFNEIAQCLLYMSGPLDPIIFTLRNKHFRNRIKILPQVIRQGGYAKYNKQLTIQRLRRSCSRAEGNTQQQPVSDIFLG